MSRTLSSAALIGDVHGSAPGDDVLRERSRASISTVCEEPVKLTRRRRAPSMDV